jgi:putative ABC transport system substrate-binding protein
MAPGTRIGPTERKGTSIEIALVPKPEGTLARLKSIQPSLKRLGILWLSPAYDTYVQDLKRAGEDLGIEITSEHMGKLSELPETLRQLKNHVDALWIPPDPLLIRPETLTVLSQFSLSNKIPYYSPVAGLVNYGAMATYSIDYEDIGRTAAVTAANVLKGDLPSSYVYPSPGRLTISLKAVEQCGLSIPKEILDKAEKVVP